MAGSGCIAQKCLASKEGDGEMILGMLAKVVPHLTYILVLPHVVFQSRYFKSKREGCFHF